MRLGIRALGAFCAVVLLAGAVDAAELVMFRRDGCPWCAKWDREIGPIYPKTELGRRAPLRMVHLDRNVNPMVRTRGPIRYTPTFVLADNGEELGRIEGYPGDAHFWGLLEQLLESNPAKGNRNGAANSASPLPWGEAGAQSAPGERLRTIDRLRPPHPNPLPSLGRLRPSSRAMGEREHTTVLAATSNQIGQNLEQPWKQSLKGVSVRGSVIIRDSTMGRTP